MSTLDKLACMQNRKDEAPNQELAKELARTSDKQGIREIAENIWNKDKNIQSDCIGVIEYLGNINPQWIEEYVPDYLRLLRSMNNRLVWGGMTALSIVAERKSKEIFEHRNDIVKAIATGSVITVDNGIKTLARAASVKEEYNKEIFPFLIDHLKNCRPKDVPQHAESIACAVRVTNKEDFLKVLALREYDLSPSQIARITRISKRIEERR